MSTVKENAPEVNGGKMKSKIEINVNVRGRKGKDSKSTLKMDKIVSYGLTYAGHKMAIRTVSQIERMLKSAALKKETTETRKLLDITQKLWDEGKRDKNGKWLDKKQEEAYDVADKISTNSKNKSRSVWWGCILEGGTDKENITGYTGLLYIDLDKEITPKKIEAFKRDPHLFHLRQSVSGKGYHALFQIPIIDSPEEYKDYWRGMRDHIKSNYDLVVDDNTSNVNRAAYLSYDSEPYFNHEAEVFDKKVEIENGQVEGDWEPPIDPNYELGVIVEWFCKHPKLLPSHEQTYPLANAMVSKFNRCIELDNAWRSIVMAVDKKYGGNTVEDMWKSYNGATPKQTDDDVGAGTIYSLGGEGLKQAIKDARPDTPVSIGGSLSGRQDSNGELLKPINNYKGKVSRGFKRAKVDDVIKYARTEPPRKMLFDTMIRQGDLSIIFASTGIGKTLLTWDIARHVVRGEAMDGFRMDVLGVPTLYCDFEMTPQELDERERDVHATNPPDPMKYGDKFQRLEYLGVPTGKDKLEEFILELEDAVREDGIELIVIDNLMALEKSGQESEAAAKFMERLKFFVEGHRNLTGIAIAHTPKKDTTKIITKNDLKGSSSFGDYAKSIIAIGEIPGDDKRVYLKLVKSRGITDGFGESDVAIMEKVQYRGRGIMRYVGRANERDLLDIEGKWKKKNADVDLKSTIIFISEIGHSPKQSEIARVLNVTPAYVSQTLKEYRESKVEKAEVVMQKEASNIEGGEIVK